MTANKLGRADGFDEASGRGLSLCFPLAADGKSALTQMTARLMQGVCMSSATNGQSFLMEEPVDIWFWSNWILFSHF